MGSLHFQFIRAIKSLYLIGEHFKRESAAIISN